MSAARTSERKKYGTLPPGVDHFAVDTHRHEVDHDVWNLIWVRRQKEVTLDLEFLVPFADALLIVDGLRDRLVPSHRNLDPPGGQARAFSIRHSAAVERGEAGGGGVG